jgi:hypothetical protein
MVGVFDDTFFVHRRWLHKKGLDTLRGFFKV